MGFLSVTKSLYVDLMSGYTTSSPISPKVHQLQSDKEDNGNDADDEDDSMEEQSSSSSSSSSLQLIEEKTQEQPQPQPSPSQEPSCLEKRRKNVTFSETVACFEISKQYCSDDIPSEEFWSIIWYSEQEYELIKKDSMTTLNLMQMGCCKDNDNYCSRGLENKTREGYRTRQRNKINVREAVLREQMIQRNEGFPDPDEIAQASMEVTYLTKEVAIARARDDAKEAEKILECMRLVFR